MTDGVYWMGLGCLAFVSFVAFLGGCLFATRSLRGNEWISPPLLYSAVSWEKGTVDDEHMIPT